MYNKITKTQAISDLLSGKEVVLCPCNLRVGTPWLCESVIDLYSVIDEPVWLGSSRRENRTAITKHFDEFLKHYKYYNCNGEAGSKVSYYSKQ